MINERMEEQAALHVLGALTETEAREFKRAMQADPELRAYVARLSIATEAIAGAVPAVEPPPQLRARVLAQVAPRQKMVAMPERKSGPLSWLPGALAAGLAAVCVMLYSQQNQLQEQVSHLNAVVRSLQETNRLANVRIAMLNSVVAKSPKTMAVTLWDNQKQTGVFMAENLKPLPPNRDYELWVMDENQKPVAAGVFQMDANGNIRMEFKPSRMIKSAGIFAVTEEIKGGVAFPTLSNMVLASK